MEENEGKQVGRKPLFRCVGDEGEKSAKTLGKRVESLLRAQPLNPFDKITFSILPRTTGVGAPAS